jgi:hypothetical protein
MDRLPLSNALSIRILAVIGDAARPIDHMPRR